MGANSSAAILRSAGEILSGPTALRGFNCVRSLCTPAIPKEILSMDGKGLGPLSGMIERSSCVNTD